MNETATRNAMRRTDLGFNIMILAVGVGVQNEKFFGKIMRRPGKKITKPESTTTSHGIGDPVAKLFRRNLALFVFKGPPFVAYFE